MKNIALILLITISSLSKTYAHNNFNTIQASTITEIYYNKLEISTRIVHFTNKYLDRLAKERPEISAVLLQSVKNSIDYNPFKNLVINVLNNNFTVFQMQQTITEYNGKPYIPILHLKLRNELQLASQEFDIVLLNQINTILIANGYQSITL